MDIGSYLGLESDPRADAARAARGLVRRAVAAWLSTARGAAAPALVPTACDLDGSPLLVADADLGECDGCRLSFAPDGAGYGVVLSGALKPMVEGPPLGRYIARFCNRHHRDPSALQDDGVQLYHFEVEAALITAPDESDRPLQAAEYLLAVGDAPEHTLREWDNLAHQNYQHLDINEQLVTQILGRAAGRWLLTGLDPEGMDFRLGRDYCRLPFPEAALERKPMGDAIKAYLKEARARLGIDWSP